MHESFQRQIIKVQDSFAKLKDETNREAEFSRVARKASDNL